MTEARRPLIANARVLPACAVVEAHNTRFTVHRISEPKCYLPHFVAPFRSAAA